MIRAKRLEANSSRMIAASPSCRCQLAVFNALALYNRHLSPGIIEPDIPRNMSRSSKDRSVSVDRVKTIVKGIVDFRFDKPAADPKSGNP